MGSVDMRLMSPPQGSKHIGTPKSHFVQRWHAPNNPIFLMIIGKVSSSKKQYLRFWFSTEKEF